MFAALGFALLGVSPAHAVTVSATAGTGANVTGIGAIPWSNAGNITTVGTPYATVRLGNAETSNYLLGNNFGFNVPATATITGIQVTIMRQSSAAAAPYIRDNVVRLVKGGTITGSDYAATTTNWPGSMAAAPPYGAAPADPLWGTTWTPADINSPGFGVVLSATHPANGAPRTASVDYIQVTVDYAPDSTKPDVVVNQAVGQADPTNSKTISYDVVFSEPVTGVDVSDFSVGGSATGFAVSSVTGSGSTYVVTASGTTVTDGTVALSMPAGGAQDAAENTNNASTSADSSVTYDGTPPTVSVTAPYADETLTGTATTVGGLVADAGTGVASVGVVIQYTDVPSATTYYWNGIGWQTTPYLNPATITGASWAYDWAFSPARQQPTGRTPSRQLRPTPLGTAPPRPR